MPVILTSRYPATIVIMDGEGDIYGVITCIPGQDIAPLLRNAVLDNNSDFDDVVISNHFITGLDSFHALEITLLNSSDGSQEEIEISLTPTTVYSEG